MATAAPSAPSPAPAAPGGAEAAPAEAKPSTSTPTAQPVDPGEPSRLQEPERKIKPIKPRPPLPGVDDAPPPMPPNMPPGLVPRGPDRKFVKPGAAPAKPTDPSAPADPNATPQPKFKFGDVEFESEEKAIQNFKTLRGMHKTMVEKVATLERTSGDATNSAWGWKAEHDRVLAELTALKQGRVPAATPQPTGSASEPAAAEGIDWALFKDIREQAIAAGEPHLADVWLAQENAKQIQAAVQKIVNEKFQPVEQQQQFAQAAAMTEQLVNEVASLVYADGTPAYPELKTPATLVAIGKHWVEQGGDPRSVLTKAGLRAAVNLYRETYGKPSVPASTSPAAPTTHAPAATPSGPTAAQLADSGLDGGEPPFHRESPGASDVPEVLQRVRESIRTETKQINTLGFGR